MTDRLEYRFNNALNAIRKQKPNDFLCSLNQSTWTAFSTCNTLTQFFFDYGPCLFFCFKAHYQRTMFAEHRQIDRSHSPEQTCEKCLQFNIRKEWISCIWKITTTTTKHTQTQVKRRKIVKIAYYIMERTLKETEEVHVSRWSQFANSLAFECFEYKNFCLRMPSKMQYQSAIISLLGSLLMLFCFVYSSLLTAFANS